MVPYIIPGHVHVEGEDEGGVEEAGVEEEGVEENVEESVEE